MDVRMPDGTIIRGVPDGMSKSELMAKLTANGYSFEGSAANMPATGPTKSERVDAFHKGALDGMRNYDATDAIGGQARGAGSLGATILAPVDALARYINNGKPINIGGYDIVGQDRRVGMDAGLKSAGVNTDSTQFKTNKLIAEVAGTSGIGGLLGKGAQAVGAAPSLVSALQTGGLNAAGQTGLAGVTTRALGGSLTGGATAGLVNPEDALTGAVIGGVMPGAIQAAGGAGKFIKNKMNDRFAAQMSEFNRKAPLNETIKKSVEAGYIIPPNMVNPSLKNQVIESISGKQATQQIASGKNEQVTGSLVRKALGIADDVPITTKALEDLRKTAGKTYAEVSSLSPQAAADLEALKVARNEATGWFNAYNRSARPDDLLKAKEARALSDSLEQALEAHALDAGKKELIPWLREARKQIAKTYTVGRALNDASGTVDARVLGRLYEKGVPLSDGLDTAGRFASAFPTVAKSTQQTGSQAAHNLKSMASLLTGAGGAAAMGPMGVTAAAIPFVAPPIARSIMFREGAQNALVKQAPMASSAARLTELLDNAELQQLLIRTAPVTAAR